MDQGGAALKAKEQPKMVAVRFWLKFHVDYGQSIRIIGGHDAMGESAGRHSAGGVARQVVSCKHTATCATEGMCCNLQLLLAAWLLPLISTVHQQLVCASCSMTAATAMVCCPSLFRIPQSPSQLRR
jgi:hypothetical protein